MCLPRWDIYGCGGDTGLHTIPETASDSGGPAESRPVWVLFQLPQQFGGKGQEAQPRNITVPV